MTAAATARNARKRMSGSAADGFLGAGRALLSLPPSTSALDLGLTFGLASAAVARLAFFLTGTGRPGTPSGSASASGYSIATGIAVEELTPSILSSSFMTASIVSKRSRNSGDIIFLMTPLTSGGTFGSTRCAAGGCSCAIRMRICRGVFPWKGGRPATMWKYVAPSS